MTHDTPDRKKDTPAPERAGGVAVEGFPCFGKTYGELVDMLKDILDRYEQGEYYLPEDIIERLREI